MKPEEAIDAIKSNMPTKGTYTILTEGLELAIQALEKQVAKKPSGWSNECWSCTESLGIMANYCYNCGQAIDWSEEE